ncbi:MAG: hypothetical protein KDB74_01790 [Flavobacteriales bacterium]|nr:hypothetical protein [Flavobacteriales bacterium]
MTIKFKSLLFVFFIAIISISSCKKDDDADRPVTEVDKGSIFPDKVVFNLTKKNDSTYTRSFAYNLPSSSSNVRDTIVFPIDTNSSLATYNCTLEFFENNVNKTDAIRSLGTRYMICFKDFSTNDLSVAVKEFDSKGIALSLTTEWKAKLKNVNGNIRITLNYNQQEKIGTCDTGSRIVEIWFPYKTIED